MTTNKIPPVPSKHREDASALEKEGIDENSKDVEWVHGGLLGPFSVAEPVPPGSLMVIKCAAFRDHERHLLRFDPPNGLAFSSHNQTKSGFIKFYARKGAVDVENNTLPEVSCQTLAATAGEDKGVESSGGQPRGPTPPQSGSSSFHSKSFHGKTSTYGAARLPRSRPSSDGTLNASQTGFLLLLVFAGAYYCYKVFGLSGLLASLRTTKAMPSTAYSGHHHQKKHHPSRRKHKGAKGVSNRVRKSSSDGKEQGKSAGDVAATLPPTDESSSVTLPPSLETNSESTSNKRRIEQPKPQHLAVEAVESAAAAAAAASADGDDDTMRPGECTGEQMKIEITESETTPNEANGDHPKEQRASTTTRTIHREEGAMVAEDTSQREWQASATAGDSVEPTILEQESQSVSPRGLPSKLTRQRKDEVTTEQEAADQDEIIVENKDSVAGSAEPSKLLSTSSSSKQRTIIVLLIEGMTCGGCVKVVNRILNSFDEIDSVVTDLRTGTSTLSCNVHRLNLLPILTALDEVGMEAYLQSSQRAAPPPTEPANARTNDTSPDTKSPVSPCPVKEQQIKKQNLGAIGRPATKQPPMSMLDTHHNNTNASSNPLSLMDELRKGSRPLRRYRCSCGCEGCICSASKVHAHDDGNEVSLKDLCDRLETTLGTTRLQETLVETGGGSPELRDQIEKLSFPCGCSDNH
jgi:copper chaperone